MYVWRKKFRVLRAHFRIRGVWESLIDIRDTLLKIIVMGESLIRIISLF